MSEDQIARVLVVDDDPSLRTLVARIIERLDADVELAGTWPEKFSMSRSPCSSPPEDVAGGLPEMELRNARRDGRADDRRWHVRKDRSQFFADGVTTSLIGNEGEFLGYSKIAHDATNTKLNEDRLVEAEERHRLLLENVTGYAIFMLDSHGRVSSWNREEFREGGGRDSSG